MTFPAHCFHCVLLPGAKQLGKGQLGGGSGHPHSLSKTIWFSNRSHGGNEGFNSRAFSCGPQGDKQQQSTAVRPVVTVTSRKNDFQVISMHHNSPAKNDLAVTVPDAGEKGNRLLATYNFKLTVYISGLITVHTGMI